MDAVESPENGEKSASETEPSQDSRDGPEDGSVEILRDDDVVRQENSRPFG